MKYSMMKGRSPARVDSHRKAATMKLWMGLFCAVDLHDLFDFTPHPFARRQGSLLARARGSG